MTYGTILPTWWPVDGPLQQPDSDLDYSYIADIETQSGADPLAAVSVSVAPSGTGEVTPHSLSVSGNEVIVWMAGGVAGRRYQVKLRMTTAAGRVFERIITLPIDPSLAVYPLPTPPSAGFGIALSWP